MGTKLIYQNWNREDGLMAEIFSSDGVFTLFCKDTDAGETFATFRSIDPAILVEKAEYFLQYF